MWSPKALRASAGAHFKIPIFASIPWEELLDHISPHSQVFLADNSFTPENVKADKNGNFVEDLKKVQMECQHFKGCTISKAVCI